MSNKRVDRLEVGAEFPKAPNDEVVWIDTEENTINRYNESNDSWVSVGGSDGNADTANFDFDYESIGSFEQSRMTVSNNEMLIRTTIDEEGSNASLVLRSASDLNIQSTGTMRLMPNENPFTTDQYIVIDPTAPNHIHIRAGGDIDESNADLIIGGERNNVVVSDYERSLVISTRPSSVSNTYTNLSASVGAFITDMSANIQLGDKFENASDYRDVESVTLNSPSEGLMTVTVVGISFYPGNNYTFISEPTYDNSWEFGSDGYLTGPAMGGLFVSGILNGDNDLWIASGSNVVISSGEGMGVFLENQDDPDNQVATIGDIPSGIITNYMNFLYHNGSAMSQIVLNSGLQITATPGYDASIVYSSDTSDLIIRSQTAQGIKKPVYLFEEATDNQIATLGDLPTGATGSFTTATHSVTVTNGIITDITAL